MHLYSTPTGAKSKDLKGEIMDLKPSSKGNPDVDLHYDPESETMRHDSVFQDVAPGASSSGSLKYKWGAPEAHTRRSAPPSDLKGE